MREMCSHCKRGEIIDVPAIGLFKGIEYPNSYSGALPYRAYLCENHRYLILADGGTSILIKPLTKQMWVEKSQMLWKKYEELKRRNMGKHDDHALMIHRQYMHAQDMAGQND